MNYLTINARKARNNFSDLLDLAQKKSRVILTRFDKPIAVLTDFKKFNPKDYMSSQKWSKGFKVMDKLRKKAKKTSNKEAITLVEEVLKEI